MGFGMAFSDSSGNQSRGFSILIPGIRFGWNFYLSKKTSMVVELAMENFLDFEKFQNGKRQNYNSLGLIFSAGFKF
jgi:hypothetical protein